MSAFPSPSRARLTSVGAIDRAQTALIPVFGKSVYSSGRWQSV